MNSTISKNDLIRYPLRKNELLLPWDAADDYLIEVLSEYSFTGKRILIINDHFGAIGTQFLGQDLTVYTDSYISYRSIKINSRERIEPIMDLDLLEGIYDYVLIRAPKNLAFFEDILCCLTKHLGAESIVLTGFMVKYFTAGLYEKLERVIGTISPGLAKKKARVVRAMFEREKLTSPYPTKTKLDSFERDFIHHSNLFSRDKLDIGTRFLLENMPAGNIQTVLDLGCANGVLGIRAKQVFPSAAVCFSDESAMAIKSARANYNEYFGHSLGEASFHLTNCFEDGLKNHFDLVLCNPPFHQGTAIGDHIAFQMFQDAKSALKLGGTLRVVGNSHLGYQQKMKKIFGNCKIIATNKKFMILDSHKSSGS